MDFLRNKITDLVYRLISRLNDISGGNNVFYGLKALIFFM